jgi:hypothetical protein
VVASGGGLERWGTPPSGWGRLPSPSSLTRPYLLRWLFSGCSDYLANFPHRGQLARIMARALS